MKLHPGAAAALIAVMAAIAIPKGTSHGLIDNLLLIPALLLIWWLISDFSAGRLVDPKGHERPSESFAFLAGKKLNRVWRYLSRNATPRN